MAAELVSGPPGLEAVYEDGTTYMEDGVKKRKQTFAPIVGYLKSDTGDLIAAIVGDGGRVVSAAHLKGFCGTRWSQHLQGIDIKSGDWMGDSVFDRVDGIFDTVFGRRRRRGG